MLNELFLEELQIMQYWIQDIKAYHLQLAQYCNSTENFFGDKLCYALIAWTLMAVIFISKQYVLKQFKAN